MTEPKPTGKPGKKSETSGTTTSRNSKATDKQKAFAQEIVGQMTTGNKLSLKEAAKVAYPDSTAPKEMGYKAMNSPGVQGEITNMMEMANMSRPKLIWKLREYMDDSEDERLSFDAWKEAAKLNNLYPEKVNKNLNVNMSGDNFLTDLAKKYEEKDGKDES